MLALNSATKPVYRSNGQRGFTRSVIDDPRHVTARKFEREVRVRFATEPCTVQTPEGQVHAKPGDAILTGVGGERRGPGIRVQTRCGVALLGCICRVILTGNQPAPPRSG